MTSPRSTGLSYGTNLHIAVPTLAVAPLSIGTTNKEDSKKTLRDASRPALGGTVSGPVPDKMGPVKSAAYSTFPDVHLFHAASPGVVPPRPTTVNPTLYIVIVNPPTLTTVVPGILTSLPIFSGGESIPTPTAMPVVLSGTLPLTSILLNVPVYVMGNAESS